MDVTDTVHAACGTRFRGALSTSISSCVVDSIMLMTTEKYFSHDQQGGGTRERVPHATNVPSTASTVAG